MSYDLNVLVINQKIQSKITNKCTIKVKSEKDDQNYGRYYSIWPFISSLQGIWYCLGNEEDGWFNTLEFLEADFDSVVDKKLIPAWITDEKVISNLVPLIIKETYMNEFKLIIHSLLKQSPDATIIFMGRFQGGEMEIINGVMSYSQFIDDLSNKKILFNMAYIISA